VAARAALRAVALEEGSWEDGAEAVGMAVAVKAAVGMARRGDAGRVRSFAGARGGKGREEKSFAGACGDRTATAREVVRGLWEVWRVRAVARGAAKVVVETVVARVEVAKVVAARAEGARVVAAMAEAARAEALGVVRAVAARAAAREVGTGAGRVAAAR